MPSIVTQEQFIQTLKLLEELRQGLHTRLNDLSEELQLGITEIKAKQDKTNGRLNEHDLILNRLSEELAEAKGDVTDIMDNGCSQKENHVPRRTWKTPAVISGGVVGAFLLGLFTQYAGQILHWIAHVLLGHPLD